MLKLDVRQTKPVSSLVTVSQRWQDLSHRKALDTIPEFQQHGLLGAVMGFEPMTRCFGVSWLVVYQHLPMSTNVEYFTVLAHYHSATMY